MNGIRGSRIREGDFLLAPVPWRNRADYPTPLRSGAAAGSVYLVRSGDSLWKIAGRLGLDMNLLMRANQLTPRSVLQIGQRLAIPGVSGTGSIEAAAIAQEATVNYRVKRGDSLSEIAGQYKVTVGKLAAWNDIDPKALIHPGQQLVLHLGDNPAGG